MKIKIGKNHKGRIHIIDKKMTEKNQNKTILMCGKKVLLSDEYDFYIIEDSKILDLNKKKLCKICKRNFIKLTNQ